MKRTIIIGTVIVGLVLFAAVTFAYPRFGTYGGCGGVYQPEMQQIITSGSYADLETFRENVGYNVMLWINDEETFKNSALFLSSKNDTFLRSFKLMQGRYNSQAKYGMMGWRAWR
jgi:hypothetical protein